MELATGHLPTPTPKAVPTERHGDPWAEFLRRTLLPGEAPRHEGSDDEAAGRTAARRDAVPSTDDERPGER